MPTTMTRDAVLEHAGRWPGTWDSVLAAEFEVPLKRATKLYAEMVDDGLLDLRDPSMRRLSASQVRKLATSEEGAAVLLPEDAPEFADPDSAGPPPSKHHRRCERCNSLDPGGNRACRAVLD